MRDAKVRFVFKRNVEEASLRRISSFMERENAAENKEEQTVLLHGCVKFPIINS